MDYFNNRHSQMFTNMCKNAATIFNFDSIAKFIDEHRFEYGIRFIYNEYIGWAVPSKLAIDTIYAAWIKHVSMHPQAKLVDFGAGSGVFSHLLALRGVPRKRIVAVELDQPTHGSPNQRQFFPLTRGYTIKPVDMLLLCWGTNGQIVSDFPGDTCCIIGETSGGCTTPADMLVNDNLWETEMIKIIGAASAYSERLAISVRKQVK